MLALDFLLLIMIGICITYCWILNRRIQDLQNSRIEFARMIKELNVSIVKAETSVSELSELSKVTSHELKTYITEAKATTDELSIINDISSNLANTLTNQVNTIKREQRLSSNHSYNEERSNSSINEESRFNDDDLIDLAGEEEKKPTAAYSNHLKSFISQIVTKKPENMSLNQASYYDTLRRISAKK